MLKILVAIDHTVESTFALRTACRLAKENGGCLEAIHVLDPSAKTKDWGAGWALHTYKRERLRDAYSDIEGVISSENQACDPKPVLKVVFGDVVKEILRKVTKGSFDVLFLGSVHPLEGPHQGILLKVLSKIRCPVVIVKHYRPLRKVLLFVRDGETAEMTVSKAEFFLRGLSAHLDLVGACETGKETSTQALLEKARERLLSLGFDTTSRALPGDPIQEVCDSAPRYDLVILRCRHPGKPDPLVKRMFQGMPASLMICP